MLQINKKINNITIIVPMHNTTKYASYFYNMFKNDLLIVFDRCNIPDTYHGKYKYFYENSTRWLAGKIRNIGIEGINTDILFFDEDKIPSENPIPLINSLKTKYDVIVFLPDSIDPRKRKLNLSKPNDFVPITNYGLNNFIYTCGIYLNKSVINTVRRLNNGNLFHPAFDGIWGGEDDFLGDEIIASGYKVGYITTITLNGSINEVDEQHQLLHALNINNFKRRILNRALSDKFKKLDPYIQNTNILNNILDIQKNFLNSQTILAQCEYLYYNNMPTNRILSPLDFDKFIY